MSLPPHFPNAAGADNEYVAVRCLIANIHKPRNVSRPPVTSDQGSSLEVLRESPTSSEAGHSDVSVLETIEDNRTVGSEINYAEEVKPTQRAKSNSFAGSMMLTAQHNKRRRPSFLHLHLGGAGAGADQSGGAGPLSASAHLSVPRFTVTAPPGEQRRHSHGFAGFHGFALRRHSNTVWEWMQV